MQLKEGGPIDVDEVIAVTMGPETAVRALHKAVSLGADRSVHLTDEALAGSDVNGTGYSLAQVLAKESPDLVLLGQQSDDGECYTIGAVVADHLQMPSLTQVIKIDVEDGKLRCERQAEYGYDTVLVELPAVISVGDAINEPRYPSLKAIMGAKKKPLESVGAGRRRHRRRPRRLRQRARPLLRLQGPAGEVRGPDHRGRGHERDGREDRRLAGRKEAAGMSGILVYALHYDGAINKNSLGAVSEGARLASELGTRVPRDRGRRQGRPRRRRCSRRSAPTARRKVFRVEGPEGLAQPVVDAMAKVIGDGGHGYALFGGGLLGFEIGAGLAARLDAGVCMEVTSVRVEDGKLVAERPILKDSQISDVHYRSRRRRDHRPPQRLRGEGERRQRPRSRTSRSSSRRTR